MVLGIQLIRAVRVLPAVAFYRIARGVGLAFEMGDNAGVVARGPVEQHLDGSAGPGAVKPDELLETKPWGLRHPTGNRITFAERVG